MTLYKVVSQGKDRITKERSERPGSRRFGPERLDRNLSYIACSKMEKGLNRPE